MVDLENLFFYFLRYNSTCKEILDNLGKMESLDKKIFIQKLCEAFEKIGLSNDWGFRAELAKKYKMLPQTVGTWLNPEKGYPKLEMMVKISEDTGMTIDELLTGKNPLEKIIRTSERSGMSLDELTGRKQPKIPVITLQDAAMYDFDVTSSTQEKKITPVCKILHPLGNSVNDLIGVIHKGESMRGTTGYSFPDGMIVVFDTSNKNPTNGDLVLAYLPDRTVIFRKYVKEGSEYLLPLNPQYPLYDASFSIIGVFSFSLFCLPS